MTTPTINRSRRKPRRTHTTNLLSRPVGLRWLNAEMLGYLVLIVLSTLLHLWQLGNMAMHHDESIHAYTSWRMFTGQGGFSCGMRGEPSNIYCYNPVFHGPTLYITTAFSYFLFGDSEATARLPMAVAGIALVASCWMLRPLVGKRAALLSAAMITISPTILYFTRFARHDALALLFTFWLIVGLFRYLQDQRMRWLHLAAAALALLWATHELVFIILFIIVSFWIQRWLWEVLSNKNFVIISAVLMVVTGILMIFQPSFEIGAKPANQAQNIFNLGGPAFIIFITLLMGQIISLRWTNAQLVRYRFARIPNRQLALVFATFAITFVTLFSTFFTYPRGVFDGLVEGIGYWLFSQHSYARGDQPWYYYFMQMGIYEIMAVLLMFAGLAGWLVRLNWRPSFNNPNVWDEEPVESVVSLTDQPQVKPSIWDEEALEDVVPLQPPVADLNAESLEPSLDADVEPPLLPSLPLTQDATSDGADYADPTLDAELSSLGIYPKSDLADSHPKITFSDTDDVIETVPLTDSILADEAETIPNPQVIEPSLDAWPELPIAYADVVQPAVKPVPPMPKPAEEAAETIQALWVGFLFYWAFMAFTTFSWAGEKMPWLTIHIALPTILAGAWALDRILDKLDWRAIRKGPAWLIVPLTMGGFLLFLTAVSMFKSGADQGAQQTRISSLTLFALILAVGFVIWQVGSTFRFTAVMRLIALGIVAMLAIYTVRSTVMANYYRPDVPVEFLVYTQTAPDVPIIVKEIERIAVVQNRTSRSVSDPIGGNSMKILLSGGDPNTGNSEGSLHQPFDWYLRNWSNVQWKNKDEIAKLDANDLTAPVAIFSKSNFAADTEQKMADAGYVKAYSTFHNWWFPEWSSDGLSSYKEKLYDPNYGCDQTLKGQRDPNGRAIYNCKLGGAGILTWPLRPSNWKTLQNYMLNREFPSTITLTGREIVVFIKRDLVTVPNDPSAPVTPNSATDNYIQLVSEDALTGERPVEPRGIATGPDGSVYIADAPSNRILIYTTSGETRVISDTGEAALQEPSGVTVDAQGFVYVADTWNARIAKFDPSGKFVAAWGKGDEELQPGSGKRLTRTNGTKEDNLSKPLGFFGPRNVFVSATGRVYIADTGNKRIVVTDNNGRYLGQVGTAGSGLGQFNEPIGLGMDAQGRLYVGDTWNGRVQIFQTDANGLPQESSMVMWNIAGWNADTYLDPFIAVDPDGRMVVTVPSQNRAVLYNNHGEAKLAWGGNGTDNASLSGPSGVSFSPTGGVYIAEKANQRIQRWELPRVK